MPMLMENVDTVPWTFQLEVEQLLKELISFLDAIANQYTGI